LGNILFLGIAKFFGQQPSTKKEKEIILLHLLIEKKRKTHFVQRDKVPGFLELIIGWGKSAKAILNETLLSTQFQFVDSVLHFGQVK